MLYVLSVSRLVPVLLALSAALVASRLLHDRLAARSPLLSRFVLGAIPLTVALLFVPFVLSSGLLVAAELAYREKRWEVATERFESHLALGASLRPEANERFGFALLFAGRFGRAADVLRPAPSELADPDRAYAVVGFGIAAYYAGRVDEAARALRSVPASAVVDRHLLAYFLGRLSERRGDLRAAGRRYAEALDVAPGFYPALYQLCRVERRLASPAAARERLAAARRGSSSTGSPPAELERSLEPDAPELPEREFVIVPR